MTKLLDVWVCSFFSSSTNTWLYCIQSLGATVGGEISLWAPSVMDFSLFDYWMWLQNYETRNKPVAFWFWVTHTKAWRFTKFCCSGMRRIQATKHGGLTVLTMIIFSWTHVNFCDSPLIRNDLSFVQVPENEANVTRTSSDHVSYDSLFVWQQLYKGPSDVTSVKSH